MDVRKFRRARLRSMMHVFFFSSRRRHTRLQGDWSSDVCSSDLYLYLIPIDQMGHLPLVAADAAQRIVGQVGVGLVAVLVMLATFSTLVGSIFTSPRIFFAMADDGLLFRQVVRVHPRFHTPSVSIVVTGALGVVWVLLLNFDQLADQFVVAIFPFYALAAAAVFALAGA